MASLNFVGSGSARVIGMVRHGIGCRSNGSVRLVPGNVEDDGVGWNGDRPAPRLNEVSRTLLCEVGAFAVLVL